MTRDEIQAKIIEILFEKFEIENPGPDDDLREQHGFDSIDAIELLEYIEGLLETQLSQEEKKEAMGIRTISQICDYIEDLAKRHA